MSDPEEQLEAWFARAESEGPELRIGAANSVQDWKWSKWWLWNPQPFWFERGNYARGKPFKQAPESPEYHHFCTGFDELGRVSVERQYSEIERQGKRWFGETVFVHAPGMVFQAEYDHSPEKELKAARVHWLEEGQAKLSGHMTRRKTWFEEFDWSTDGRLVLTRSDVDGHVIDVDYDFARNPVEVRQTNAGRTSVIWQRRQPKQTISALGRVVTDALVQRVVQRLKAWSQPEPAWCLALSYSDDGNAIFPPLLGVGFESERRAWLAGKNAATYLWNPAEYRCFDPEELSLDLPGMDAQVRMLNQLIADKDAGDKGVALVRRVAKELRELDWSELMDVADDFVVFSVGTELVELEKDLKNAFGAKRFKELKKDGLVP